MVKFKKDLIDLAISNGININNKLIINEIIDLLEENSINKFDDGTSITKMRRNSPRKSPMRKIGVKKTPAKKISAKNTSVKKTPVNKTLEKKTSGKKTPAKKTSVKKISAKKTPRKKTAVNKTLEKKTPAKKTSAKKTPVKKTLVKKTSAKKTKVKKTPVKKTSAKKTKVKKTPVKKNSVKKTPVKKTPVKKTPVKKTSVKKTSVKKTQVKKTSVKKTSVKKTLLNKNLAQKNPERETPVKKVVVKKIKSKKITPKITTPEKITPKITTPEKITPKITTPEKITTKISTPNKLSTIMGIEAYENSLKGDRTNDLEKPIFGIGYLNVDYKIKVIENFEKSFKWIKNLGKGTFGSVKVYLTQEGKYVAIKKIKVNSQVYVTLTMKEIEMFEKISGLSDSFPKYYDSFLLFNEDKMNILIVQEYIDGIELYDFLDEKKSFTEDELIDFAKWLFSSVRILHKNGIVHRDIKTSNIMVEKETGRYVLIDFGGSCMITSKDFTRCNGISGTYFSPEMLTQYTPDYTRKDQEILYSSDIWCCGFVLYNMTENKDPFIFDDDDTTEEIEDLPIKSLIKIGKNDLPFNNLTFPTDMTNWNARMPNDIHYNELIKMGNNSKIIKNVIKSALIVNYKNRPSAKDILNYLNSV